MCGGQIHRVSIGELKRLMRGGDMLLHSITTSWLAMEHLQAAGYHLQ